MHSIKIIAPRYLVEPLKILGLETFSAGNENEARQALAAATESREPALVFITEALAKDLMDEIDRLNKKPGLNVVLIPDNRGSIGLAEEKLSGLVRNSIGAEVVLRK